MLELGKVFYQQGLHPLTLCRCTAGLHFSYSLVIGPRLVLLILPLVADSGKPGIVYCRSGTMEGLASHATRQRMLVSLCWGKFFHKSHCQQSCHCLQLLLLLLGDIFLLEMFLLETGAGMWWKTMYCSQLFTLVCRSVLLFQTLVYSL
jgi:hypothetical protein